MRNEARVNKCDEMLRQFAAKCVFLTVTCDFDMLFCCFLREERGGRKKMERNGWIYVYLIMGDAGKAHIFSILRAASCVFVH